MEKTQNVNEYFNNVVCKCALKNVFLGHETSNIATMDAVWTFSHGSITQANIFSMFSIFTGCFIVEWLWEADRQ